MVTAGAEHVDSLGNSFKAKHPEVMFNLFSIVHA
jgi:hypothetical protein